MNTKTKGALIVVLLCLALGYIQQKDLFKSSESEPTNYCVTPLYVYPSFNVVSNGISITSDSSLIAVLCKMKGLHLITNSGEVVWSRSDFGGNSLITKDGNYLVTQILPHTEGDPPFLAKTDQFGNILWKRAVDSTGIDGLAITSDASFIAAGYVGNNEESYVTLFDGNGNTLWDCKTDARIHKVDVSKNGHVVTSLRDGYIHSYDSNGELIFKFYPRRYHGLSDTAIAPDGSFFLSSSIDYLKCYTLEGEYLWSRVMGDRCSFQISEYGNFIVVGTEGLYGGILFLLDRNGNKLWHKKVTDAPFLDQAAISSDCKYIAVNTQEGSFSSTFYLEVYSRGGKLLWRYKDTQPFEAIAVSDDGHYIAAGNSHALFFFDNFAAIEEVALQEAEKTETEKIMRSIIIAGGAIIVVVISVVFMCMRKPKVTEKPLSSEFGEDDKPEEEG